MTIYDRIKELCKSRGISVRELEKTLGFSYGAVSKWAVHSPSYDKLSSVAEYFGVYVSYLTGERKEQEFYLTGEDLTLLSEYKALNDEGKRKVREYTRDIFERFKNV